MSNNQAEKPQIENERLLMQSLVDQIGNDNTPATRGAVKIRLSNMIDRLVSKPEKEEEWISCEDYLPDSEVEVLTIDSRDNDYVICWIDGEIGSWQDNISGRNKHVTHWRKLPSPPKTK